MVFIFVFLFFTLGNCIIKKENSVLVLTDQNVHEAFLEHDMMIVKYYAPWCHHCKALMPEWEHAAFFLSDHIPFAKVDATKHRGIAVQHGIKSYPTIKMYLDNVELTYNGARSSKAIQDWIYQNVPQKKKEEKKLTQKYQCQNKRLKFMNNPLKKSFNPFKPVIQLNGTNFKTAIENESYILVNFYSPHCKHCQALNKDYEKAAKMLQKNRPIVHLARIDATKNKAIRKQYNIQTYPTLIFFQHGKPIEYKGIRETHNIIHFVRTKVNPTSVEKYSPEKILEETQSHDVVVVFFGHSKSSYMFMNYLKFTTSFADIRFLHVFNDQIKLHFEIQEEESILLLRNFDSPIIKFEGEFTQKKFNEFIVTHSTPCIQNFDQKQYMSIFHFKITAMVLFTTSQNQTELTNKADVSISRACNHLKGKMIIIKADIDTFLGSQLLQYLDINQERVPLIQIIQPHKNGQTYKYNMDGDFEPEIILQFRNLWADGLIKAEFKTELPKLQIPDTPIQLVSSTFKDFVIKQSIDVLVYFYDPTCYHCQKLDPIYEQIFKKFDNEDLLVAKIDVTQNEIEGVAIEWLPSIKLYKKDYKKSPITFQKEFDFDKIAQFISMSRTNQIIREINNKVCKKSQPKEDL